jgi:hypothetical protein
MAGAIAEARPSQKAASILNGLRAAAKRNIGAPIPVESGPDNPSRECDGTLAGRTHAPNPLPQRRFTR